MKILITTIMKVKQVVIGVITLIGTSNSSSLINKDPFKNIDQEKP